MADTSLADKLKTWKLMVTGFAPDLAEVPNLREEHEQLTLAVAEIDGLDAQEEFHTSHLRETVKQRLAAEIRGTEAYTRLFTGLQSHFGKRSTTLIKYGIKPLNRRRRKPGDPEEEKPPQPPTVTAKDTTN